MGESSFDEQVELRRPLLHRRKEHHAQLSVRIRRPIAENELGVWNPVLSLTARTVLLLPVSGGSSRAVRVG